jgi:carbon storage regulator
MLVLTRKLGEEIVIDGDIRVTVVEVANGRVKLGIVAPKSVRVDRSEVREQRERADAPLPPAILHNRLTESAKRPGVQADTPVVVPVRPTVKRKSR